jgi:hypothetical protein
MSYLERQICFLLLVEQYSNAPHIWAMSNLWPHSILYCTVAVARCHRCSQFLWPLSHALSLSLSLNRTNFISLSLYGILTSAGVTLAAEAVIIAVCCKQQDPLMLCCWTIEWTYEGGGLFSFLRDSWTRRQVKWRRVQIIKFNNYPLVMGTHWGQYYFCATAVLFTSADEWRSLTSFFSWIPRKCLGFMKLCIQPLDRVKFT